MKLCSLVLSCGMAALASPVLAGNVFEEKGGIVAIEAESTDSSLGSWKKKTDVAGYSGDCHLEFTGNKPESGPPKSPLKFKFRINKGGEYQLTLRARKRLESKRSDISNDCFVAVKGNYTAGGGAPLDILRKDTKMYGGNANDWGWTTQLDFNHKKAPAKYNFEAGETYELTISGRSKNFNIDRLLLVHTSKNLRDAQRDNPKESDTGGGLSTGSSFPPRVQRTLRNNDGRALKVTLIEMQGNVVLVEANHRRYRIPVASLSKGDQEYLKEWSR